ncbi:hypothetical protein [Catenulispora rubra]|uniref:hypothetical protein n=1 Tax=Catenulispora rubra TaxID=280293 RepID=UPI0018925E84|nr:hypothetical protein [Catenulispora rubra]
MTARHTTTGNPSTSPQNPTRAAREPDAPRPEQKALTMTPTPAEAAQALRAELLAAGWTAVFEGASPMQPELKLTVLNDPAGLLGLEIRSHPELGMASTLFWINPGASVNRSPHAGRWRVTLADLPAPIILAAAKAAESVAIPSAPETAGWAVSREARSEDGEHLIERTWASADAMRELQYLPPCRHEEALWVISRPHPDSASTRWIEDVHASEHTPPAIIAAIATA